jgi:hypothetical protein
MRIGIIFMFSIDPLWCMYLITIMWLVVCKGI